MRFGGRRDFGERRFGGPRFDRGFDQPKPVKVGEEYDVEIKETGSKGDGIARINNFVVFVNGVKLGEKAHIKITDVRNRFAIGEKTGGATEAKAEVPEEKEVETTETAEEGEESSEGEKSGEGEESSEEE